MAYPQLGHSAAFAIKLEDFLNGIFGSDVDAGLLSLPTNITVQSEDNYILNDGNIAIPCLPRRTWQSGKVTILGVVTFGASLSYDNRVTLPAWQTDLAIWQSERSNADRRETNTTVKREVTMYYYDSVTPVSAATGAVPSWQSGNPGMV